MAKEIVPVLEIKTGNSENTIKALKKEISELRKSLESAEIGSAEFTKATNDLNQAQNNLKSVLDLTKKSVNNADGSYNALQATMSELRKEWKATNDEAKRDELGKQIDKINNQLKSLDASIGNNQRNVGNYKQDFVDAMVEMKQGSFDFGKELGEVNKSTEITRNSLDGVGKVASGLASGFAAVQGVTALLGIENENLEKSLVKVQSAMAIAQGIGGMKGLVEGAGQLITAFRASAMASKAMETQTQATTVAMTTTATATNVANASLNTFKATLISTGIGALIVALGTLVGYLISLAEESNNAKKEMDDLTDSFSKFMDEQERQQSFNQRLMKASGESEQKILLQDIKDKTKNLQDAQRNESSTKLKYGVDSEQYKQALEELDKYTREYQDAQDNYQIFVKQSATDRKKAREEEIRTAREQREQARQDAEKIQQEIELDLKDGKDRELAILEKNYEEKKKVLQAGNKDIKELDDWYNKQSQEIENKYASQTILKGLSSGIKATKNNQTDAERRINNSYAIKMSDATNPVDAIQLEIDKTKELQATREEAFNKQMQQIQDILDAEKEKNVLTTEQEKQLLQQYTEIQNQKVAETENANTQIVLLEKDKNELIEESNENLRDSIVDTIKSSISSASQILNTIADNVDTTTKEGFETSKKMRIASATMSTLGGIIDAWTSAMNPDNAWMGIWGQIATGAATSALIATTGALQVGEIQRTTFDGGGSINASATPNISMADAMPIAYTRELLTDTETTEMNSSQKVYVVESDITNTQRDVEVKEQNATF